MKELYFAKSVLANGKQPTVPEHLNSVAELAQKYGKEIGMEADARMAGDWHDAAKYSNAFQAVLKGTRHNIDHAFSSAVMLYFQTKGGRLPGTSRVMTVINAHHDGLIDYAFLKDQFHESLNGNLHEANNRKEPAINGKDEYRSVFTLWYKDHPGYRFPILDRSNLSELEEMLRTRMLYSCLVDADYSASAMDENPLYLEQSEDHNFNADTLLNKLYDHCDIIRSRSKAEQSLNRIRNEVFDQCGKMGEESEGLFTLTSPTGTGKTLAMLHFALRHCKHTGKKRIIVVLPFLTLTEQNAAEYRSIVGNVLEDHSQNDLDDKSREISERWSAPFIITTSVKFFETLFSDRPGDCRKLHNIANSVVLFDEAQTLPQNLLTATLCTVNDLCRRYHVTMVFSTATQPAFDSIQGMNWRPKEILPNNASLFHLLKRTRVDWRIGSKEGKGIIRYPFEVIADEMAEKHSVCAIVNLRRHARKLYGLLKSRVCDAEAVFYLTTDLCPAHRTKVIEGIKDRQRHGLCCYVVATQCIEAGVDLDFDDLYRTLAPLESIIQAAGRCNRNGRNKDGGQVVVFEPEEEKRLYPDHWYEHCANEVKRLNDQSTIDIHDPDDINRYYSALYRRLKENKELKTAIESCDYPAVKKEYRLIPQSGIKLLVPYSGKLEEFRQISEQMKKSGVTAALLRKAAPITISTFIPVDELEGYAEQMYYPWRNQQHEPSDVFVLLPQCETKYTEDMGFQTDKQATDTASFMI